MFRSILRQVILRMSLCLAKSHIQFSSHQGRWPLLEEELEMDGVTVECDPLKLNRNGQEHEKVVQNKGPLQEEGMAFNEEPMKLTEAEELFGSKIKRKWQEEEEDDAKRGENTSVDASGTANDRWKNLASMEKHFEVKEQGRRQVGAWGC